MADIYHVEEAPQHVCWDRKYYSTFEDQLKVLTNSKTIYVGNLSFFTTEQQIHEVFSVAGPICRIIMGLNQKTKTPCGFCFVEYYRREHASACLKFVSGTMCDDRIIRCDMDGGFRDGRQFGRGPSGGQMRDDRRASHDPARGGIVGGGALVARRPPPRPFRVEEEEEKPVVLGTKRGRDDDETTENEPNLDAFGRDKDNSNRKKITVRDPLRDPMTEGLSARRPPPKTDPKSDPKIDPKITEVTVSEPVGIVRVIGVVEGVDSVEMGTESVVEMVDRSSSLDPAASVNAEL